MHYGDGSSLRLSRQVGVVLFETMNSQKLRTKGTKRLPHSLHVIVYSLEQDGWSAQKNLSFLACC
jgi:hypothetical protein